MAKQKECRFKHSELQRLYDLTSESDVKLRNKLFAYMKQKPKENIVHEVYTLEDGSLVNIRRAII